MTAKFRSLAITVLAVSPSGDRIQELSANALDTLAKNLHLVGDEELSFEVLEAEGEQYVATVRVVVEGDPATYHAKNPARPHEDSTA